jgi:hypothetical protein
MVSEVSSCVLRKGKEMMATGEELIAMNIRTFDKLLHIGTQESRSGGAYIYLLYTFYKKMATLQQTTTIKCTNDYAAKALSWKASTVQKYKALLRENGFIETIQKRGERGRYGDAVITLKRVEMNG